MPFIKEYFCPVMKRFRWPAISMIIAILAITGFQAYWLKNNYDREKQNLDIKTSASFRQTILKLQASKLRLERIMTKDTPTIQNVTVTASASINRRASGRIVRKKEPVITMLNLIEEKIKDSLRPGDSARAVTMLSLNDDAMRRFVLDSFKKRFPGSGKAVRSVNLPRSLDSLDPALIQKIVISKDSLTSGKVIAINYGNKPLPLPGLDTLTIRSRSRPAEAIMGRTIVRPDGHRPGTTDNVVYRFLYDVDSLYTKDSVTVQEVTKAFATRLKEDKIDVAFKVDRLDSASVVPNAVTIGFTKPTTFGLSLHDTFGYMLDRLKLPLLFSLLLIGITIAAFVLLYRNMIKQQRLAELKNEFISNVTHELKTPIATVGVAIEALKNFNAIHDPARTREYLDISQNELQRLNLLVDKVLKLSVFEKQAIELRKEPFDLKQLTEEIMNSMKLQFEKYRAQVTLQAEGTHFTIEADKLHITSVVYNLLDNALKYSRENPVIGVQIKAHPQHVELSVSDNGIGIPPEYKGKVFDKFFRVPTGNRHNIKGYGLGLSYVSEVLKRHHGFITVESEVDKGSTFTVHIPYTEAPEIWFDEKKVVKNKKQ